MHILIDMQAAQTTGSRNRGIGRYGMALAKELVRQRGDRRVSLLLNGMFSESIKFVKDEFSDILPDSEIFIWDSTGPVFYADERNSSRRLIAERVREIKIGSIKPDFVLNTSVIEGFADDAVCTVKSLNPSVKTASILYDLIPYIYPDIYLQNPVVKSWYLDRLLQIQRSDLLLSISESSGKEAIDHLSMQQTEVVNISTACDEQFQPIFYDKEVTSAVQKKYNISKPFVMYTGGIDHRKNIEGLIEAFSKLNKSIRQEHQLAIVCSISSHEKERLSKLATECGLMSDDVSFTGFISDEDLLLLYNTCKLFVFPSWHEGFGLPALEAMACGKAVIGSNVSSIPEVINNSEALFDPMDTDQIAALVSRVLSDDVFREDLEKHSSQQAKKFSWKSTAERTWRALEIAHKSNPKVAFTPRRKLAYFSPLPDERSGIANYSNDLLPQLSIHYDIDVITNQESICSDWHGLAYTVRSIEYFKRNYASYDRVLYHFGNSHFHTHMLDLLKLYPGVVVLHDFYLSGMRYYREAVLGEAGEWSRALCDEHGWKAVLDRHSEKDISNIIYRYPTNREVLDNALGVIVHSKSSRRMAQDWYGNGIADEWSEIPLTRVPATKIDKVAARKALRLNSDDFIVCSFGMVAETKLHDKIISAWTNSPLSGIKNCHLVFVGENSQGEFGNRVNRAIKYSQVKGRIEVTGWVDQYTYNLWLEAADVGIQLRTLLRGETSAAVYDCFNYGLATIVNANGALADIDSSLCLKIDDNFSEEDLILAFSEIYTNDSLRTEIALNARKSILTRHNPRYISKMYFDAIEGYYSIENKNSHLFYGSLTKCLAELQPGDYFDIADTLSLNFPPKFRTKVLYIDEAILNFAYSDESGYHLRNALCDLIVRNDEYRVELVSVREDGIRLARKFVADLLEINSDWAQDDIIEMYKDDVLVLCSISNSLSASISNALKRWTLHGSSVYVMVSRHLANCFDQVEFESAIVAAEIISKSTGVLTQDIETSEILTQMLDLYGPDGVRNLNIWFDLNAWSSLFDLSSKSNALNWDVEFYSKFQRDAGNVAWSSPKCLRYLGSDLRLNTQVGVRKGAQIFSNNDEGYLVFGPYAKLATGTYEVTASGSAGDLGGVIMDAVAERGGLMLFTQSLEGSSQGKEWTAGVTFRLEKPVSDFEFRIYVGSNSSISLKSLTIRAVEVNSQS